MSARYPKAMRLKCNCDNEWMDKRYGKGYRVHNRCQKGEGRNGYKYRCVVCQTERKKR